jgi:hypothetical protein
MERIITITTSRSEQYAIMSALDAQRNQAFGLGKKAEREGDLTLAAHYEAAANSIEALRMKVFTSVESWAK